MATRFIPTFGPSCDTQSATGFGQIVETGSTIQRDPRIVLGEEGSARARLVDQEHLVVAGDRHGDGRQHRTRIGDEYVDLVLRDELVVERRGGRRIALVVVGDERSAPSCSRPSRTRRRRRSSGRSKASGRSERAWKSKRSGRPRHRACRFSLQPGASAALVALPAPSVTDAIIPSVASARSCKTSLIFCREAIGRLDGRQGRSGRCVSRPRPSHHPP